MKTLAGNPENTVLGLARNKDAAENRIKSDGFDALILEADITDQAALTRAAETAAQFLEGNGVDVVINNAAYVSETTALKSFDDLYVYHTPHPHAPWELIYEVRVISNLPLRTSRRASMSMFSVL